MANDKEQKRVSTRYSLDCKWYPNSFDSIHALVAHVIDIGMDPHYEILANGRPTGEMVIKHMPF